MAKAGWRRADSGAVDCRYHLKDVIVGKIYFLLVRIKIKHMELSIIRRETTGAGQSPNQRGPALRRIQALTTSGPCALLRARSTESVQRV